MQTELRLFGALVALVIATNVNAQSTRRLAPGVVMELVFSGDLDEARRILERVDVNAPLENGHAPIYMLTYWFEGFGDSAYEREAAFAELLFELGADVPSPLPNARALDTARRLGYEHTLAKLDRPISNMIEAHSRNRNPDPPQGCSGGSDVAWIVERDASGRVTFSGCSYLHDGTATRFGVTTRYWPNGRKRSSGTRGGWGPEGMWLFWNDRGEELGRAGYFRGKRIWYEGDVEVVSRRP